MRFGEEAFLEYFLLFDAREGVVVILKWKKASSYLWSDCYRCGFVDGVGNLKEQRGTASENVLLLEFYFHRYPEWQRLLYY